MSNRLRRSGFTLIELLVVIAIIGVLAGLLLPAVNAAREAGRRTQCMNNMRQLGLGIQGYINARNSFPNSVTWGITSDPTDTTLVDSLSNIPNASYVSLDPATNSHDIGPLYSWVVDVLPYIELQSIYNDYNRNQLYYSQLGTTTNNLTLASTDISILTCPNDDSLVQGQGNLSYACNSGFNLAWWSTFPWQNGTFDSGASQIDWGPNNAKKSGLMWPGTLDGKSIRDYKATVSSITDGMSTTVMLAENIRAGANPISDPPTNWASGYAPYVAFMASDDVCTEGGTSSCSDFAGPGGLGPQAGGDGKFIDGLNWSYANRTGSEENIGYGRTVGTEGSHPFANSLHPGIVVVTMCDGSTRTISETIDGTVWAKLMTPAGQNMQNTYKQLPVNQADIGQ